MIIDNFDIPGVTVPELERNPPRIAGRNSPLISASATQVVQANRFETGQIVEPLGLVQQTQTPTGQCFVDPGKRVLSFFRETLGRPVRP
jgi:hypothetical protein